MVSTKRSSKWDSNTGQYLFHVASSELSNMTWSRIESLTYAFSVVLIVHQNSQDAVTDKFMKLIPLQERNRTHACGLDDAPVPTKNASTTKADWEPHMAMIRDRRYNKNWSVKRIAKELAERGFHAR